MIGRRNFVVGICAGMLAAPLRMHTQAAVRPARIALVDTATPVKDMVEGRHPYWGALLAELRSLGYVEGRTVAIERWSGEGESTGNYAALARKVVASRPDSVVAFSRVIAVAMHAQTGQIPIVAIGTIPTELRNSLAHPGKNVTGIHVSYDGQELYRKQLAIFAEVLKRESRLAYFGPRYVWENIIGDAVRASAREAGFSLEPVIVASPINEAAVRSAFREITRKRFDGVMVSAATELYAHRKAIAELAVAARMPTCAHDQLFAAAGALMSYGVDRAEVFRRGARRVDKILKGAKPGEIPIEQPTRFELVVNGNTAKALRIRIPDSIRLRADRMIE